MRRNERISPQQKGFKPVDGCHEHNLTLQSVITDAKRKRKGCVIAWLEFRNALGSVPHNTKFDALR